MEEAAKAAKEAGQKRKQANNRQRPSFGSFGLMAQGLWGVSYVPKSPWLWARLQGFAAPVAPGLGPGGSRHISGTNRCGCWMFKVKPLGSAGSWALTLTATIRFPVVQCNSGRV